MISLKFPESLNFFDFEKFLDENKERTTGSDQVHCDLSDVSWVGILQLSLLYGWIQHILDTGARVSIDIPKNPRTSDFISATTFIRELSALGCQIHYSTAQIRSEKGLVHFRTFKDPGELAAYEQSLIDKSTLSAQLGSASNSLIVQEGTFRTILVHELGENCFFHGGGKGVRYAVTTWGPRRYTHSIMSDFDGAPTLEVVVSDSGPGLIGQLKGQVPSGYTPHYEVKRQKITNDVRVIAYALELFSTRDPKTRDRRIQDSFGSSTSVPGSIATGLWYVRNLAERFGGQVIIRTGKSYLNLDFSRDANGILDGRSNCANVDGTHVLFRAPSDRHTIRESTKNITAIAEKVTVRSFKTLILEDIAISNATPSQFADQTFQNISSALNLAHKNKTDFIVVLCDGLTADNKAFSVLVASISMLPRKGRGLLFLGLRDEHIEAARQQWQTIRTTPAHLASGSLMLGQYAFVLVSTNLTQIVNFGETSTIGSTIFCKSESARQLEINSSDIRDFSERSHLEAIREQLTREPTKHSGQFYYLIERRYYTREFYEIRRLFEDISYLKIVGSYVNALTNKIKANTIYCIAASLFPIIDEIVASDDTVSCHKQESSTNSAEFIRVLGNVSAGKKLLILTDVICSAESVVRCLRLAINLEQIEVLCFVDGRKEQVNYITLQREKGPQSVWVHSVLKSKIHVVDTLTESIDPKKVRIIDKTTNSPTAYDIVERDPILKPDQFIEAAYASGALKFGHIEYRQKHFSVFIDMDLLLFSFKEKIWLWWDSKLKSLETSIGSMDDRLFLFVDEQEGLSPFVTEYFSYHPGSQVVRLESTSLHAPRDKPTAENKEYTDIWLILDSMALGDTAGKALEFITRQYLAKKISVLVVVGRMDLSKIAFWQRITSYANVRVEFDFFAYLPTGAFMTESSCPMCNLYGSAHAARRNTHSFHLLNRIAEKESKWFKRNLISHGAQSILTLQDPVSRDLESIRSIFVEAYRDIDRRKDLSKKIKDVGIDKLLSIFALDVSAGKEQGEKLTDDLSAILYKDHNKLLSHTWALLGQDVNRNSTLFELLGALAVFPKEFCERAPTYLSNALKNGNSSNVEHMIFIGLIFPEVGRSIRNHTDRLVGSTPDIARLIDEINLYPSWDRSSYAVDAFHNLLWMLKRSSPWHDRLHSLGTLVQLPNIRHSELAQEFRAFREDGYFKVNSLISTMMVLDSGPAGDSLWRAIKVMSPDIDETVGALRNEFDILSQEIEIAKDTPEVRQELAESLYRVRQYGRQLKSELENIYLNVMDVEEFSMFNAKHDSLQVVMSRAPQYPGILISFEDMRSMLNAVWENALICAQSKGARFTLQISFEMGKNGTSDMCISDDLPWESGIDFSGGTKSFDECCRRYGAFPQYNPASDDGKLRIRVTFRPFNPREKNEPRKQNITR
jgi:orotate phosphoribosyltransferase